MSRGRLGALLLGLGALVLGGCFRDTGVVASRCTIGESTCSCRDGDSPCDEGLVCDASNICRSVRCEDGREGCACVDGSLCLGELECIDQSCLPPDGTDDSGSPTTTGTTTSNTTSQPVTTAMPTTTGDPDTSGVDVGPGTTNPPPDTDDTSGMTSGPTTSGGGPVCNCGWSGSYYDCGLGLPPEPVDEMVPPDCPDQVLGVGEPCGTITGVGCCMGDVMAYCVSATDGLWVADCGAMDELTCGPSTPPA